MKRDCSIYRTVRFTGKRWTMFILLELYKGNKKWKRYSELKRSLENITPKMLSSRLKELLGEGLIKKRVKSDKFPVTSEYCLTRIGEDFINIIKEMKRWSLRWRVKNKDCEQKDCKSCEI